VGDGIRPAFARYWVAAGLSSIGSAITAIAMPVLVVQLLGASPFEVGVVNAAQFVPYAALGLVAGVYVDHWRRKPVLMWASVGRALCLGLVPILWLADALQIWMLVVTLLAFGAFSVFGFAATQSLLPRLVPSEQLVAANARLDQADAAAQTVGPAIGGGLIGVLGAPAVIVVDAISYLVEAVLIASIHAPEPRPEPRTRNLHHEIGEGLKWTYHHRTLGPLAASTHIWFLANGAAMTALSLLALRSMGFTAYAFGMLLTAFGVASLIGASLAPSLGGRLGAGRVIILARTAYPITWMLVAWAPESSLGGAWIFVALGLQGIAAGIENANEMAYWQTLTPDRLLGRVNATRRSINQTMAALGAVLGGLYIGAFGEQSTLATSVAGFTLAVAIAASSPLRRQRRYG